VVRQYALTSANDFPQRDPRDWRLLGSNDGGQTWTTLDSRKGEIFSERHQRRVFTLANHAAFNLYRLQIDRVRDPSGADSVQLAEIEATGDTQEDVAPTPTAADVITAQGAKVPMETADNAFDGQIETKWLDFAMNSPATRASWIQWQYSDPSGLQITNVEQLLKLRAHAGQGYEVRIEGVVAGPSARTNGVWFLDATGTLEIPEAEVGERFLPGQRVLLEGTSQWTNKQAGIQQPRLQRLGPEVPAAPNPMALEQSLKPGEDLQWVQVEGQVGFVARVDARLVFELEDGDHSVSVHVLQPESAGRQQQPAGRVRVHGLGEGVLDRNGKHVLGILWAPRLDEVVAIAPAQIATNSAAGSQPTLTNARSAPLTEIGKIRRLTQEQLSASPRVKIRGVAIFGDYVHEGTECIETWRGDDPGQLGQNFVGDYLEAEGKAVWVPGRGPVIKADKILVLGKGKLPRPDRPSWNQLASGAVINQWM